MRRVFKFHRRHIGILNVKLIRRYFVTFSKHFGQIKRHFKINWKVIWNSLLDIFKFIRRKFEINWKTLLNLIASILKLIRNLLVDIY